MKHIEVVAAIINQEGTYFATQRGYGEYEGMWEFPGGKIEPGESEEEALQREIHEELGIDVICRQTSMYNRLQLPYIPHNSALLFLPY